MFSKGKEDNHDKKDYLDNQDGRGDHGNQCKLEIKLTMVIMLTRYQSNTCKHAKLGLAKLRYVS
jgi:hypothetical protein